MSAATDLGHAPRPAAPYRPPVGRRPIVPREHLIAALNAALDPPGFTTRLTLVSAPAGFGKTTLVAQWLSQPWPEGDAPAVAWVSLEAPDNDPGRFTAVVSAAISEALPGLEVFSAAAPESQPIALMTRVLTLLRATDPLVLVLDDYHVIANQAIHEAVGLLLDRLPPSTHVVLLSRTDPPLNLARRRVRLEMTEIRVADLRFSMDEAGAYLNGLMRLDLQPGEVAVLERRTEGWIAGLQLAAHSLRLAQDRSAFLADFAGDDRYVADYLLEEVLLRQPPEVQAFLLETSILDRLHPDLVEVVTGRPGARSLLSELEHANLFVVPLDNRRQWYRYHRLFADLLRRRLTERDRDVRPLHLRAARWFAANNLPLEGVGHALEAGDAALAADLITLSAPTLFMESRLQTMTDWFHRLSQDELTRRPALCLGFAWAWLATGHPTEAETATALAERFVGHRAADLCGETPDLPPPQAAVLIESAAIRSRIAVDRLAIDEGQLLARCALEHIERAIEALAAGGEPMLSFNPPQGIRPVLLFNLGLSQYLNNGLDDASRALAAAADEAIGNGHLIGLSLGHLAGVERLRGRLRLAEATAEHAIRLVESTYGYLSPMAGLPMAQLGGVWYDRGELDAAASWWQKAIELGGTWESWEALTPALLGLARLERAAGNLSKALERLDELEAKTPTHTEVVGALVAGYRDWFLAEAGGDVLSPHPQPSTLPLLADQVALCSARAQLARGRAADTIEPLTRLGRGAAAAGRYSILLEAKVLLAAALAAERRSEAALDTLDQALAMAAGERVVQPFREAGGEVNRLLKEGLAAGRLAAFASTILGGPGVHPAAQADHTSRLTDLGPDSGILETLTEREREVLNLIATGLSNREIGDRLYLTEGTVKNHAHNIYEKLGVGGRTQAIARARTLGYLTS